MKKFLILTVFAFIGALAFSQEKIAVFPFEDMDNVFNQSQPHMFYDEFSNAFSNANKRNGNRFIITPRLDYERLINFEAGFQLSDYSEKAKTAEWNRVLSGNQILSGRIARVGSEIRVTVSLFTYPELNRLPGGASIATSNVNELFSKIPELVQSMYTEIAGGRTQPEQTTVPVNFVHIQGGTFLMGSPNTEPERQINEGPQHLVTVDSFYMGKYEVTQREYQIVIGTNPSYFRGDNLPVTDVSWYDAIEYCNALSMREGLTPVYTIDKSRSDPNNLEEVFDNKRWLITWNRNASGYRLPTEAEWEYACRAGTTTPFSTGNNISTNLANYNGEYPYNGFIKGVSLGEPTTIGSYAPNPWGLYDMHGNVWEWCWDWYGSYSSDPQTNPTGSISGFQHITRGGYFGGFGKDVRSAHRFNEYLWYTTGGVGFRLVRNAQ